MFKSMTIIVQKFVKAQRNISFTRIIHLLATCKEENEKIVLFSDLNHLTARQIEKDTANKQIKFIWLAQ